MISKKTKDAINDKPYESSIGTTKKEKLDAVGEFC
jgi:hypothetical protein